MSENSRGLYDLKKVNRRRIYKKIRDKGNISRTDLSYELQLSLPTVNQNLLELIEEGYIRESGLVGKTGGRRATVYSICENAKVAVGVDITRNHITVVCVNLNADCIYTKRIRYPFARNDEYLKKLSEMISDTVAQLDIPEENFAGVGIAVPGLITPDGSRIFYGESLNFTNMTCLEFARYISFPCKLYNDADAAGYAEAHIGTAIWDSFYISLNNSVGGAILIDGKVYSGERGKSGEIGHMTLEPDGGECFCGQRGCLDVYCNATVLAEAADGDLKSFFERLEAGDEKCRAVWDKYLSYLAQGINNIRMLFDCKIILGGYVGAYMEPYIEQLKRLVIERNPFESEIDYLRVCKVKREASAIGAALPYIQKIVDNI